MSQANGEAERAVQTAKSLMITPDPSLAMLNYRATPHSTTGVSPAEALMGRKLKTRVPTLIKNLIPNIPDAQQIRAKDNDMKKRYKADYDRRYGVKSLSPLEPDTPVLIKMDTEKTWEKPGSVVLADPENRRYLVNTPTGMLRRNRRHLQPAGTPAIQVPQTPPPSSPTSPSRSLPMPRRVTLTPPPSPPKQDNPPRQAGYRTRFGRLVAPPVRFPDG